jgi:hypothetical protein
LSFHFVDYLEQPGKITENIRDNLFSPIVLSALCYEKSIHFTYLGTGCIFQTKYDDNDDEGNKKNSEKFTEDDVPNFFGSSYSIVKGFTDRIFHLPVFRTMLNLRIRMPITGIENERNFITKITNYEKICSMPNSMSVLPDLLPIVFDMMMNGKIGTYNLVNPGLISHNEILSMYKELVDPNFSWINFSEEEQRKILASGRSNNYLCTDKLQLLYPHIKNIKQSVRDILISYADTINIKQRQQPKIPRAIQFEDTWKEKYEENSHKLLVTGGCAWIKTHKINIFVNL